jgi:predicted transcriptional regulator
MKSEIKILKFLLRHKEEKFTIRKISERIGINYRIAYEKTKQLSKEGTIKINKFGNSNICELTGKFDNKIFQAEYERREELFKNKTFLLICNDLSELKFPFVALLFGSQSKGIADKHSDIDILTIGGDEEKISSKLSIFPDKIHLTSFSYEEFISMAKSKEFTVVSEAIKNNILLVGIEEYYRLLSNAK